MPPVRGVLYCIFITLLLAGCAATTPVPGPLKPATLSRGDYGYTREYASWLIRQEMETQQVTGLSIALVDDQKVVWSAGFGYADRARGVPATAGTIYRAGSLAKLFTATAAMQLADDGLLDIDQPLQRYLPGFSVKSRFMAPPPLTARSILTHHSGLPADLLKGMWTSSPVSLAEEVQQLEDEYAATPPGTVFADSNVGISLLGHTLEKIVDRDFAAHMGIALFLPLRMDNSTFSPKIDRSSLASKAYRNGEEAVESPLRDIPAAGLNTTVLDLSRFIAMVFGNGWYDGRQVLRSETVAAMLSPQNSHAPLDLDFQAGLGWMLDPTGELEIRNAGPVAHHGGATLQHRSQLIILPEQKLGVVVLANSATAGSLVKRVAAETLQLALEAKAGITQAPLPQKSSDEPKRMNREQLRLALEATYGVQQSMPKKEALTPAEVKAGEKEERKPLTPEELQAYEGRYDTIVGLAKLTKKSDYLEAQLPGRSVRLVPRPNGLLEIGDRAPGLVPVSPTASDPVFIDRETINGHDLLKAVVEGREYPVGVRLKPAAIPATWQQRAGAYEIVNREDDAVLLDSVRLNVAEDLLTLEYTTPLSDQPRTLALTTLSDTEAVIAGLGQGKGETVRVVARGDGELLTYSGYLLRKKAE